MEDSIGKLMEECRLELDRVLAIVKEVRSGSRSWSQVWWIFTMAAIDLVKATAKLWPHLKDREARPYFIVEGIAVGLEEMNIDLPGDDRKIIEAGVRGAVIVWRIFHRADGEFEVENI